MLNENGRWKNATDQLVTIIYVRNAVGTVSMSEERLLEIAVELSLTLIEDPAGRPLWERWYELGLGLPPPVIPQFEPEPVTPPLPFIPDTVSPAQMRLWLIANGHDFQIIEGIIATIPDPQLRLQATVRWEYAVEISRWSPILNMLGEALGMDDQQIDQAFIEASQL
jgi:hypothetical protein